MTHSIYLLRLVFYLHHMRFPVGSLGVVKRNRVSGEDRNGDILSPRRRVAGASEKHLKVRDEGGKLSQLTAVFYVSLLLGAERRRMRLLLVFFLQVRGEEAEFSKGQVRSAGERSLRRGLLLRDGIRRSLSRHVKHLFNLSLRRKDVQFEKRKTDLFRLHESVFRVRRKDAP